MEGDVIMIDTGGTVLPVNKRVDNIAELRCHKHGGEHWKCLMTKNEILRDGSLSKEDYSFVTGELYLNKIDYIRFNSLFIINIKTIIFVV